MTIVERGQSFRGKGSRSNAVLQEADENLVAVEFHELAWDEGVGEFLREQFRVGVADAKGDHRAGVSKHGLPDFGRKLVKVLMREGETEAIFAGFSQNRRKTVGGEVVEFVNEQVEVSAIRLWRVGARHGCELKLSGEQGSEQIRFVGAEFSFGQIGDEHAAGVHDEAEIYFGFHLAEDIADRRVHEELADFVLNRSNGFAHKPRIIAREFLCPKAADKRVFDLANDPLAILGVGEHAVDAKKGSVLAVEQSDEGVVKDVFHARSPRIPPNTFERGNNP